MVYWVYVPSFGWFLGEMLEHIPAPWSIWHCVTRGQSVSNAWAWLRSKEVKVSTSISKIDVTWHCGYFCWWIYANLTNKRWGSLRISMFVMFFFVIPVLYCHLFCHVWCHFVVDFSSGAGSRIRSRLASTRVIFLYFVCLIFLRVIFTPLFFFCIFLVFLRLGLIFEDFFCISQAKHDNEMTTQIQNDKPEWKKGQTNDNISILHFPSFAGPICS